MNEIVQTNKLKTEMIKLSEELTKKEKDICRLKKKKGIIQIIIKLKINFVKNFLRIKANKASK